MARVVRPPGILCLCLLVASPFACDSVKAKDIGKSTRATNYNKAEQLAKATLAKEATWSEAAGATPALLAETAASAETVLAHSTEAMAVEQASGAETVEAAPAAFAETSEVAETEPAQSTEVSTGNAGKTASDNPFRQCCMCIHERRVFAGRAYHMVQQQGLCQSQCARVCKFEGELDDVPGGYAAFDQSHQGLAFSDGCYHEAALKGQAPVLAATHGITFTKNDAGNYCVPRGC